MEKAIEEVIESAPLEYRVDLKNNAPYEKEFRDEDTHWYSPFILWKLADVMEYQPSDEFSEYLAIGSNGGMETYLLSIKDGTVFVCDLISGIESKEQVASSYAELLSSLEH